MKNDIIRILNIIKANKVLQNPGIKYPETYYVAIFLKNGVDEDNLQEFLEIRINHIDYGEDGLIVKEEGSSGPDKIFNHSYIPYSEISTIRENY